MSSKPKYTSENLQELYDDAFNYFKNNKLGRCIYDTDDVDSCAYYSDGNRCVVGHLVKSTEEHSNIKSSIQSLMYFGCNIESLNKAVKDTFEKSDLICNILSQLQSIHDTMSYWRDNSFTYEGYIRLRDLGRKYKLDTTLVKQEMDKLKDVY